MPTFAGFQRVRPADLVAVQETSPQAVAQFWAEEIAAALMQAHPRVRGQVLGCFRFGALGVRLSDLL
eukprot:3824489-Alexandrium_andersonii.AAC.1